MKKVVLASSNKGKIQEFINIFAKKNIKIVPQDQFNVLDVAETGLSFVENAILKARNCSRYTSFPSIADDSGLEVFSLNGEPGIYSARYSGEHGDDYTNIIKLLDRLRDKACRKARFVCAIAYLKGPLDPTPIISLGFLNGEIAYNPKGFYGFGYDSIFFIPEFKKTLAEMLPEFKNKMSHRAIALDNIIKDLT